MQKGTALIKLFLYYALITLTANFLGMTVVGGSTFAYSDLGNGPTLLDLLDYIWNLIQLFIGFFTFSVTGLPVIASLIFIWLPTIYILVYLLGLFRGND